MNNSTHFFAAIFQNKKNPNKQFMKNEY